MKKVFLICVVAFLCSTRIHADILTYIENVAGPVKKMTVTSNQYGMLRNWVYWYDSKGRLIESAYFRDGKPDEGCYVRQYTSNISYTDFYYNDKGFIDGSYRVTQLDSLGNKLYSKRYENGELYHMDSIVYNEKGKKIEYYSMSDSVLSLRYTYEYDSLGRLSVEHYKRVGDKAMDTYEYLPDGNFIKYHFNKEGKKTSLKHFFNAQGRIIKTVGSNEKSRFEKADDYGNWTIWNHTCDYPIGHYEYTYTREIEYYAPEETDTVYLSSEQLPEFPGGQKAMFQYIADNVIYPIEARVNGIQGRTVCQFIVNKSGDLTDVKVVKSSGSIDLDNEAVRVISSMPKWEPGRSDGEVVRVKYTVPVSFKIATPNNKVMIVSGDTTIMAVVDEMPEFPGGQQALFDYLASNVSYPLEADGAQGKVVVTFIVETSGAISNVMIAKPSGNKFLDEEAIRVVQSMPNWKPGKLRGQVVRVKYSIPVMFSVR